MQLFAKKNITLAALALCATGAVMAQAAGASAVELWGVVDVAVRHTNDEGAVKSGLTKMIGGGMSQSRWGIKVEEDLGGGSKALAFLENRFDADAGNSAISAPFFQLSYVGLQGPYGRLTAGRQWNVLFDVVSSTYASFPYSPYMEAYKPELGMAVGARASNMLKYLFATQDRSLVGALQYSFDENNTVADAGATGVNPLGALKTAGGYLRYAGKGLAGGGGFLRTTLPGGTKVDAWTVGGSYRSGPLYVNLGYGLNERKNAYVLGVAGVIDSAMLGDAWSGASNGGFLAGAQANPASPATILGLRNHADKRQLFKVGVGYQVTPQLNLGAHYFRGKQSGSATGAYNGNANFYVAVADYAFSKRTDAYFGVDHTSISGGSGMTLDAASQARSRTGITVGLRHRF